MSFIPMRVSVGTISSVSGTTGTGAAGRVAYWQDATTLTSSSSFTFDGTSLGVPDGAAATPAYTFASATNTGFYLAAATQVNLSLGGASIFDFSLYKMGVTATGGNQARVTATAANTAGSSSYFEATVLGGTGGDAYSKYSIFAAIDWFVGCDNSDSDSFKIGNGGLGTGNDFLRIASNGNINIIGSMTSTTSGGPQYVAKDGGSFGTNADPHIQFEDTTGSGGRIGFTDGASKDFKIQNQTDTGLFDFVTTATQIAGSAGAATGTYWTIKLGGTTYKLALLANA